MLVVACKVQNDHNATLYVRQSYRNIPSLHLYFALQTSWDITYQSYLLHFHVRNSCLGQFRPADIPETTCIWQLPLLAAANIYTSSVRSVRENPYILVRTIVNMYLCPTGRRIRFHRQKITSNDVTCIRTGHCSTLWNWCADIKSPVISNFEFAVLAL